ncbi:hypothetical protein ASPCAL09661 [Aspergillus calidoustus]|uniref:IQ calmodulin-binding motif protein n=1 Tax=Aspergillus calidoustus TaxID=454130 RepID=A0A0U5GYW2_ASPCI|nr:hypothetical protein ASPCAL09661 [Aspergillus calidoustus]
MVDAKHRHGSNLRKYHEVWKTTDCKENFFYWLDYGAGKDVELQACPREQLEREQVRYLSREERVKYLVTIDRMGRFRWAKDDELVWTNNEHYMDTENGIIPRPKGTDAGPGSTAVTHRAQRPSESSRSSSLDEDRRDQGPEAETGARNFVHHRHNIFKRLKDKIFLKDDWWIFVADPSYRLYIGIKKRGSFQHSSFLRGGRIGAAGLIKIRHGKLRDLAPLSGHYRPPSANFHAFVHALREQGADLSRVSITKLYASLVGIEGYFGAKDNVHRAKEKIEHKIESKPS